jgi:hypothetical protein
MNEWSFQLFNEKLGNKVEFGCLIGKQFSGKSEAAKILCDKQGFQKIDMNEISAEIKESKKSPEGDEFEGEITIGEIEAGVCKKIEAARASGSRCKFVFDSFMHEDDNAFMAFID